MTPRHFAAVLLSGMALSFALGYSAAVWHDGQATSWRSVAVSADVPRGSMPAGPSLAPTPVLAELPLPDKQVTPTPSVAAAHVANKSPQSPATFKINPNTADSETLCRLPGVGPVLASRIIAARKEAPFRTAADLRRVKGIGPKVLDKIRPFLYFP